MSEPVEYQYRTRPDWIPEWNGWNTCSKESAQAYEKTPYLHDWHYEVRRLYTTPPQRKPLSAEEIRKANHHMVEGAYDYSFKQGVKWAEYKHGIKEEA